MKSALFVLVSAVVAGGAARAEVIERIVAKVNGEIITKTELDREVQQILDQLGPAPSGEEGERRRSEVRRQTLDRMIDNLLVLQVAEDRGLRVPPRYFEEWKAGVMKEMNLESEEALVRQVEMQGLTLEDLRRQFEQGLLIQEIRRMEIDNKISVTEPEIERHYRERIHEYTEPAQVRLREIVLRFDASTEAEAAERGRRLLQDIRQGADFAEVARRYSESSSREAGGDLGFFAQGELTEALADVAFGLSPGQVSDLIRLESAYYIIKVEEKTEEKTVPLEEARKEIADRIFQEKLEQETDRYLRRLREEAIIDVRLEPGSGG